MYLYTRMMYQVYKRLHQSCYILSFLTISVRRTGFLLVVNKRHVISVVECYHIYIVECYHIYIYIYIGVCFYVNKEMRI
jgi:hypothetical protein